MDRAMRKTSQRMQACSGALVLSHTSVGSTGDAGLQKRRARNTRRALKPVALRPSQALSASASQEQDPAASRTATKKTSQKGLLGVTEERGAKERADVDRR